MKKIIGLLRPFDMSQTFYVYEDGNKVETVKVDISKISDTVLGLSAKYDITRVDLAGATRYAQGIKKQIQKAEMTKYNENKLEIKCI